VLVCAELLTLLILAHPSLIPDMSYKVGLCSQKGPLLTSNMKAMAEKYMLVSLYIWAESLLAVLVGDGEAESEPSLGIFVESGSMGVQY
jgi:hypothetical protein